MKLKLITGLVALSMGPLAFMAPAVQAKPTTFVKRGPIAKVKFGPGPYDNIATTRVRCPGNTSFVGGYSTVVTDSTPHGLTVVTEDVTSDEQGWEVTMQTTGLYSSPEPLSTAKFEAAAVCIR